MERRLYKKKTKNMKNIQKTKIIDRKTKKREQLQKTKRIIERNTAGKYKVI